MVSMEPSFGVVKVPVFIIISLCLKPLVGLEKIWLCLGERGKM